jgi:hypothetical protein
VAYDRTHAQTPRPSITPSPAAYLVLLLFLLDGSLLLDLAGLLGTASSRQQVGGGQVAAQQLLGVRIPGAKVQAVALIHDGNLVALGQELNLRASRGRERGSMLGISNSKLKRQPAAGCVHDKARQEAGVPCKIALCSK